VDPHLARKTREVYADLWDRHILGRLGGAELRRIAPEVVESFRAELRKAGVGDPTILKTLALLQGILQRAVVWRRIRSNPVAAIKKPPQRRKRVVRPIAPKTVEALRASFLCPASPRRCGARFGSRLWRTPAGRGSRAPVERRPRPDTDRRACRCPGGFEGDQNGTDAVCSPACASRGRPGGVATCLRTTRRLRARFPDARWATVGGSRLAQLAKANFHTRRGSSGTSRLSTIRPPALLCITASRRGQERARSCEAGRPFADHGARDLWARHRGARGGGSFPRKRSSAVRVTSSFAPR
jgi:hypothetical protein